MLLVEWQEGRLALPFIPKSSLPEESEEEMQRDQLTNYKTAKQTEADRQLNT